MEQHQIDTWGQFLLCAGGFIVAVAWSVRALFQSMTSSYGSIIGALQLQNQEQQKSIIALESSHQSCLEKHEAGEKKQAEQEEKIVRLEKAREDDQKAITALRKELDDIRRADSHITTQTLQDLSQKVDELRAPTQG